MIRLIFFVVASQQELIFTTETLMGTMMETMMETMKDNEGSNDGNNDEFVLVRCKYDL
jgi:hypothetical protein